MKLSDWLEANRKQFETFKPPTPPPLPPPLPLPSPPPLSQQLSPRLSQLSPQLTSQPLTEFDAGKADAGEPAEFDAGAADAANVQSWMIKFEKLQREAAIEAYRLSSLQYLMETCFYPPILGIEAFVVEKHVFDEHFIKETVVKQMSSEEKKKYKTVFKQTNVLEILGACGYMCSFFVQNDKHYRLFHWNASFGAKWAYRFATNLDKFNKITVNKAQDETTYRKIRCPNVLHQQLEKNYETQRKSDLKKSFIKQAGFIFMPENDLINKMKNPKYFFPFTELVYDKNMVKNLFRMYEDEADDDKHKDWQSLSLHLTSKAQVNITLLYTWIKKSFTEGILEIGRLR